MAAVLPDAASLAAMPPAQRAAALGTPPNGLGDTEAARRLAVHGPNEPAPPPERRPLRAFLANFSHTLALLLWFAAGLALAAGLPELGGAIVAVVLVNGIFAFAQEYRAGQVVSGLMRQVAVHARAVRDGHERVLPAPALVPGDIVRLAAGDVSPADCVLLSANGLTIDLSLLTGESVPAERDAAPVSVAGSLPLAEMGPLLPAGAAVITGAAEALVYATGPTSTLGQITALVEGVQRGASALERQVAALSRVTAVIAVLAGAATLALAGIATDTSFLAALTFATGVIVALVPEGLLPTLSVSLAIGARRMAARGAAVRRLSAVEVIGSVTAICTDKTGTLTENALSVLGVEGPDLDAALRVAVLCSDARVGEDGHPEGDALDVALLAWAIARGADITALRASCARLSDIPFDAHRRLMEVVCATPSGPLRLVKGAPETVRERCAPLPPALAAAVAAATERGERVVLLAAGPPVEPLTAVALARLHDPPRADVPEAIAACRRAGVRVAMLTGDHPATARAVAIQIGLGDAAIPVIEGPTVDRMRDDELLAVLAGNCVFARVDPRQKLRLVTVLRRAGEIVVATGDGINDAPALRAADVGVAMGRRGAEVAKQAADIVLADDHFATIVAAIEEGRSIRTNIRRFVSYVFTSNVAEVAPFLLYIFLPVPLPLAVIQALAVDLGTDLVPALALGAEPPSPDTLRVAPEPPARPLLTRALALRTFLFYGMIEATLGIAAFLLYHAAHGWRPFDSFTLYAGIYHEATAATFLGIVGGQVGCLFAQRDGPLWRRLSPRGNRMVAWGLGFELALAPALVYLPGLNRLFLMAPVPPVWLLLVPGAATVFLLLAALGGTTRTTGR